MDQAQQLRLIKARQQEEQPKPGRSLARVITVTSGKGGVGKSNTAINLAIQFRKKGKRVIILDADLGMANIEIMFGAVPRYNLFDMVYEGRDITEIITPGPMDIGFISGGSGIGAMAGLDRTALVSIIQKMARLDELADIILVDTGAGISESVMEFLVAGGEVLLVTTPEPTSITDSYSLLKVLFRHPDFRPDHIKVGMIANRVDGPGGGEELYAKLSAVVGKYLGGSLDYLGCVPQDSLISRAVMSQVPVSLLSPDSRAGQAYERIAAAMLGTEPPGSGGQIRGIAAFVSRILTRRKL